MLINRCWAICEATAYQSFTNSIIPIAFLSDELCKSMVFFKPNLCDLIIKNKESKMFEEHEFYVFPSAEEKNNNYSWYNNHKVSIPSDIYHDLIGFEENKFLSVRTNILKKPLLQSSL